MRVPLRWLSEWVDWPSVEVLCDKLTTSGLEVDAVERTGPDLSGLRVGAVVEREAHPNADKLSVCRVDVGDGALRQIVCGAPNVAAGQKVAVLLPGERLPDGTRLKKSKLRGVASEGMICSSQELGLGDDHSGILVLGAAVEVGTPLAEAVESGDVALEIAITANRGDCTSLLGIAREVRAYFGGELRLPECEAPEGARPAADDVRVSIDDPEGCYRYVARVVRNVRVGASPDWLVRKLGSAGLRSINNVVDVTNLVLWEFGQPLHAFDLDRIRGGEIRVRRAREGEKLLTLDGEQRELDGEDLVIADMERPVALAGILGGAESEVGESTVHVLIESAHFAPRRVRLSARRRGLSTDASYRFERGVDRAGIERAADRAARLVAEVAGGEVSRGRVVAMGQPPPAVEHVELAVEHVGRLLGTPLSSAEIRDALERVAIEVSEIGPGALRCRVPSHRNDVALPQDLIEEVARIHGYERIEPRVASGELSGGSVPPSWPLAMQVRDSLAAEGWLELMTFPFFDPGDLDRLRLASSDPRRAVVRVLNPISEGEPALRSTLLPSLLHQVRENRHRQVERVAIFELARTHRPVAGQELPDETRRVAAVVCRGDAPSLWLPREPVPLFFELKGAVERLFHALERVVVVGERAPEPYLHPGASCALLGDGGTQVGSLGEIHPATARAFGIDAPVALLELDLSAIEGLPLQTRRYREVSRFPSVVRDLAVLVERSLPAEELVEAITRQGGELLHSVELFDRYAGEGIPEGRVSLAFRLVFRRLDRTLTDAEVAKAVDRVVRMLANRFGGELR